MKLVQGDISSINIAETDDYRLCLTRQMGDELQSVRLYSVELFNPIRGSRIVMVIADSDSGAVSQATCCIHESFKVRNVKRIPVRIRGWSDCEF